MSFSLWLASEAAFAGCDKINGFDNKAINFDFPASLTVKYDLPVDSVIHEVALGDQGRIAYCSGNVYFKSSWENNVWGQYGNEKVIETNVPGIGAMVYFNSSLAFPQESVSTSPGAYYGGLVPIVKFIKTKKTVNPGIITPGVIATYAGRLHTTNEMYTLFTINLRSPINIIAPSCEVQGDPNKVVSFGNILNKNLASIQEGLRETAQDISIDLKCHPGTKVAVTFDSQHRHPYYKFAIANQGTAEGIAIAFYQPTEMGVTRTVIESSGESETIKQKVELYRYGTFKAGSISAQATYTLNYE